VDIDLFIDRLLKSTKTLNGTLLTYVRSTGVMQTRPVIKNYLRFASWLDLLRLENRLMVPNSYTVFFASLSRKMDFFLTDEEKIGFFLNLIKRKDIFLLLKSLKIKNSISDFVRSDLSEHFVESFFEWFVDLGLIKPTSPKFGIFKLTNLGYSVSECCKRNNTWAASETYVSNLLGRSLKRDLSISDDAFWLSFQKSLQKLNGYVRSEIDPNLYSALPLILDLQIALIFDHGLLVPLERLIQALQDILPRYESIFRWDPLAGAGYVKIGRLRE
jgi:hypothetical protein